MIGGHVCIMVGDFTIASDPDHGGDVVLLYNRDAIDEGEHQEPSEHARIALCAEELEELGVAISSYLKLTGRAP